MKPLYCCFLFMTIFLNSALAASNELKVAIFIEPPYVNLVNNKLEGEHIEIIKFLAKSISLKPEFIRCPPVRCLVMIKRGQADMMLGLSKTAAREKDLIYLDPPYLVQQQPIRFFTLKNKKLSIESLNDLEPLLVGILRGAAYFPLFDEDKNIEKVELTSRKQLVNMLLKGRIDTFLEREETVLPLLSTEDYKNKVTMAEYKYNDPINSYIVISKHSSAKVYAKELTQILGKAMTENGTIARIINDSRKVICKDKTKAEYTAFCLGFR